MDVCEYFETFGDFVVLSILLVVVVGDNDVDVDDDDDDGNGDDGGVELVGDDDTKCISPR